MTTRQRGLRSDDRGAVAIVVALFVVVFMILLAFVVDLGRVYATQAALQNAVDAAALAGAGEACKGDDVKAVSAARRFAVLNGIGTPKITGPYGAGNSEYINVRGSETVDGVFTGFTGGGDSSIGVQATGVKNCQGDAFVIYASEKVDINGTGARDPSTDIGGGLFGGIVSLPPNDSKTAVEGNVYYNSVASGEYTSTGVGGATGQVPLRDTGITLDAVEYATQTGLVAAIDTILANGSLTTETVGDCSRPYDLSSAPVGTTILSLACAATLQGTVGTSLRMITSDSPITLDTALIGTALQAVIIKSSSSADGTPEGAVNLSKDFRMYGTIYAPFGMVVTNGHGFTLKNGRIVVKNLRLNGLDSNIGDVEGSGDPYAQRIPHLAQ